METFIIPLIIGIIVIAMIVGAIQAKKRREAMAKLADELGLQYSAGKDYDMDNRYGFLDALRKGSRRYAFNIIEGEYKGHDVLTFDYHYETKSTDSKGNRKTNHHYFSYFILNCSRSFPELKISKEGFFSKIAQAVGFDDIDFESHEFSRKFCVRSKDKKFAYDIVTPQMMEYLLDNTDLAIEIDGDALALTFSRRLKVEQIEYNLDRLIEIRNRFPEYLMEQ